MGAKESRQFPLSYEDALKRVNEAEKRRLQDAFRRLSPPGGHLTTQLFIREVLGDGVPGCLAERIFSVCGGASTSASSSNGIISSATFASGSSGGRGLSFKDTFTLLLLLTRGTREEKIKFIFGLLATDQSASLSANEVIKELAKWEKGSVPQQVYTFFAETGSKVNFDQFSTWVEANMECLGICRWLLLPNANLSLVNRLDTPTFYQTLAGVTHLEEQEIVELEKRFWSLSSNSNQIDVDVIRSLVTPPLPARLVEPLFYAFDENKDGHIDFKELSCGVSAACRGPELERQKFCFKVFDLDQDARLSPAEMKFMLECMEEIALQSSHLQEGAIDESVSEERLRLHSNQSLGMEDYIVWTVNRQLPNQFAGLLFELCHIMLGLRPRNGSEEGQIVKGWLHRESEAVALLPGTVWYLINIGWWTQWLNYVDNDHAGRASSTPSSPERSPRSPASSAVSPSSSSAFIAAPYSRPAMIDNSGLVEAPTHKVPSLTGEGGKLKTGVSAQEYKLVPERVWKALYEWYGCSLPLPRQVIRNSKGQVELEVNPLNIRIYKHQNVLSRPAATAAAVSSVMSGYGSAAMNATGIAYPMTSCGASSPLGPSTIRRYHAFQAAFSRRITIQQIEDFLATRLHYKREDIRLWLYRDPANMRLLEDGLSSLEDNDLRDEDGILVEVRSRDGTWPEEMLSLVSGGHQRRTSSASMSSSPPTLGMTGLNNLGNTCYMNAALQCVANTKILAQYFNSNCHLFELNRTNPLGMKGHVAKRFGDLVREMWLPNGKAIAPIKLRWTIGRYSASFAGFQQQDSQELLAFLLDGLHEDLNRVTEKPYTELKDSDGRPDVVVAQEAWENHVLRNKSIIVDLFHGQLKSKVKCKVCDHESVRFDPFTYLSLPLPMESLVRVEVIVIRQDGQLPVKYGLILDMEAKYSELKPRLSQLCQVPVQHLLLVEIVQSQFKVPLPMDDHKVKSLNGTCIYAYQFRPLLQDKHQTDSLPEESVSPTIQSLSDIQRHLSSREQQQVMSLKAQAGFALTGCESANSEPDDVQTRPQVDKNGISEQSKPSEGSQPAPAHEAANHSRQGSSSSSVSNDGQTLSCPSGDGAPTSPHAALGDSGMGVVVALHRKMIPQEVYFLSSERYRPTLFGVPLIVGCTEDTTYLDLYKSIWVQVSRLVSPLPPKEMCQNHATDCDDSLGYEYPFSLKVVQREGNWCAWCPWHSSCRGCALPCSGQPFAFGSSFLAIDWDQTALHLRYRSDQEKAFVEDQSVSASLKAATEPITLMKCLEAFTREEELDDNEKYYCSSCKKHQRASKKLQIWRLPPYLIVHLKRFHFLNGRWIKSHKIVDFPTANLDPTDYLAAVPQKTLKRYQELREGGLTPSVSSGCCSELDCGHDVFETPLEDCELAAGQQDAHRHHRHSQPYPQQLSRLRQESTSLQSHPIVDDRLQDFHKHRLTPSRHPLDIKYQMYAMVCHSGVLGGGHYISYSKSAQGTWFCQNDSSCKEIKEEQIDKSAAYMLFYEREGLCSKHYLPLIDRTKTPPDYKDFDDDLDDLKRQCRIM